MYKPYSRKETEMADRFDYWVHGISVQVELDESERKLSIQRAGWGTLVKSEHALTAFFSFAIPMPTMLDDDNVSYKRAFLRGFLIT
jgi:hypothetical protein